MNTKVLTPVVAFNSTADTASPLVVLLTEPQKDIPSQFPERYCELLNEFPVLADGSKKKQSELLAVNISATDATPDDNFATYNLAQLQTVSGTIQTLRGTKFVGSRK